MSSNPNGRVLLPCVRQTYDTKNGMDLCEFVPPSARWNLENYINVFVKKIQEHVEIRQSCLGFNQEISFMALP